MLRCLIGRFHYGSAFFRWMTKYDKHGESVSATRDRKWQVSPKCRSTRQSPTRIVAFCIAEYESISNQLPKPDHECNQSTTGSKADDRLCVLKQQPFEQNRHKAQAVGTTFAVFILSANIETFKSECDPGRHENFNRR